MRPRFPGDQLTCTATEFNDMLRAGSRARADQFTQREIDRLSIPRQAMIRLQLHADCERFEAVGIGPPLPDTTGTTFPKGWGIDLVFESTTLQARFPFAILQEPGKEGKIVWAMVEGCSPALVEIQSGSHQNYAAIDGGILKSFADGPARILYKPTGTGSLACVIQMGFEHVRNFVGEATAAIAAGALGSVASLDDSRTVQARNHAADPVASGSKVAVQWDDIELEYYISMEFC